MSYRVDFDPSTGRAFMVGPVEFESATEALTFIREWNTGIEPVIQPPTVEEVDQVPVQMPAPIDEDGNYIHRSKPETRAKQSAAMKAHHAKKRGGDENHLKAEFRRMLTEDVFGPKSFAQTGMVTEAWVKNRAYGRAVVTSEDIDLFKRVIAAAHEKKVPQKAEPSGHEFSESQVEHILADRARGMSDYQIREYWPFGSSPTVEQIAQVRQGGK